jgi:hypothetical protein
VSPHLKTYRISPAPLPLRKSQLSLRPTQQSSPSLQDEKVQAFSDDDDSVKIAPGGKVAAEGFAYTGGKSKRSGARSGSGAMVNAASDNPAPQSLLGGKVRQRQTKGGSLPRARRIPPLSTIEQESPSERLQLRFIPMILTQVAQWSNAFLALLGRVLWRGSERH